MPNTALLVLCTCPDRASADVIAQALLERRLAACINILPGVSSMYRWQGKIETAEEVLLVIKTRQPRYAELEAEILSHHPYELPEVVAVPLDRGLPGYLAWIEQCTTPLP